MLEGWEDDDSSETTRTFTIPEDQEILTVYALLSGDPVFDPAGSYGPYVPGCPVLELISDLVGYAAKGLPTGLKFDSKTGTISGTPTKPTGDAGAIVTFTKKDSTTFTTQIIVGPLPVLSVEVVGNGKVSGAGAYAANKKVTLKATADKGNVFAGWYCGRDCLNRVGEEEDTPDSDAIGTIASTCLSRLASYVLTMPTNNITLYAKFITQTEDWATVACAIEDEYPTGVAIEPISVQADGGSLPTVKVTGLPTGLKFTDKLVTTKVTTGTGKGKVTTLVTNALPNTIYGTATKPGTYVITAKLTNTTVKKALVKKFTIVVDNLTGANDLLVCTDAEGATVALANARGESYALTVGVSELSLPRKITATTGTVKVTGLPAGLKYDAKTGAITGVATKAGTYTVYVTVGKAVSTFTVVVDPLPAWAVGNFTGRMHLSRSSECPSGMDYEDWYEDWYYGTATIDVSANGKISGKLVTDEQDVIKLSYASFTAAEDSAFVVRDETTSMSLVLEADTNLVTDVAVGRISLERGDLAAELTRNEWKKGGALAKLAASLKGKTIKNLSNDEPGCEDIIYVMDLSFSADGVVKVKYYDEATPKSSYSASGTLCLVDGDDAGEDELSLLLPLNLVKPDEEYGEVRMTISRDGEILRTELVVPNDSSTGEGLYCVVDLSGGTSALSYPVSYLASVPSGGWTDEYKTTKLVLRKIEPGTFTMGSPSDELGRFDDETQHQVTLTKGFYIGVFEVTQRQWELVMGTRPSYFNNETYYASRPVEEVSYNMIRGSSSGANWPASNAVDADSFLGKIRAKTGLVFDLPTEAQWEYACRAGTTTALNSGKNLTSIYEDANMAEVGRYWYNGGSSYSSSCDTSAGSAKVGSYSPNAWGLYDMHGNVWEWCLDWWQDDLGTAAVTDPVGATSGDERLLRGGGWYDCAGNCHSAYRNVNNPSSEGSDGGFRLSCSVGSSK